MRELYLSSVRPIISYTCAVWFVLGDSASRLYQTKQKLIHELHSLQSECLASIAGAFRRTSSLMLHKELFIMPIAVYLHQLAMAHRARYISYDEFKLIDTRSFPYKRSLAFLALHPYRASYVHAKVLAENTKPPQSVTKYIKHQTKVLSASLWRAYLFERTGSKTAHRGLSGKPVAMSSPWGPNNFKPYRERAFACPVHHSLPVQNWLHWTELLPPSEKGMSAPPPPPLPTYPSIHR